MELPQLFGSDYILPAIIAVVLLGAILGLLLLRRKQKDGPAAQKGRARGAAAPPPAPGATRGAVSGIPDAIPGAKLSRAELNAAKAEAKAQAKAAADQAKAAKSAAKSAKKAGLDVTQSAGFLGEAAAGEAADLFGAVPPQPPAPAPDWLAEDAAPPEVAAGGAPIPLPAPAGAAAAPAAALAGAAAASTPSMYTPGVREGTSFANDPLQTILNSILMGWGDVSIEDTNRLEVFKPERVLAAISAAELPKDLKSSEYARTRLNQLKRYAAYLEQDEKPQPPRPVVDDFAAIGITPQAASQIQSGLESDAATTAAASAPATTAIAGAGAAAVPPAPAPESPRPSWYGAADDFATTAETEAPEVDTAEIDTAEIEAPEIEIVPFEALEAPLFAEPPALTEPPLFAEPQVYGEPAATTEFPAPVEVPMETEPVEFSWDTDLPAAAAAAFEEAMSFEMPSETMWLEETVEAVEAEEAKEEPVLASEGPMSSEDAIAAAAAAFWAGPEADAMEQAAEERAVPALEAPPVYPEPPVYDEPPVAAETAPAAALDRLSTAGELLALPAAEQAKMLGHLEPTELSKVFRVAGDSTLKKAVIDTLERTGSTASLDVIRGCLDDPDPLIQLYALDAADRLLGTQT